jgi:hypothetical protein
VENGCSHLGLCLNDKNMVDANLIRRSGASDLDWLNELAETLMAPELNRRRVVVVLGMIDENLSWEQTKERERYRRFGKVLSRNRDSYDRNADRLSRTEGTS